MYIGSTTTVQIILDEMPEDYSGVDVIMTQRGVQVIKADEELTITDISTETETAFSVSFDLSALETQQFYPGDCQVQVKVSTDEGEVFFSDLMRFPWNSTEMTDG